MSSIADTMLSLPERFRADLAGNLICRINFCFWETEESNWCLDIGQGSCFVSPGHGDNPDAEVTMIAADFIGINDRTVDAPTLFWSGAIEVTGNLSAVIALAPVMGWQ